MTQVRTPRHDPVPIGEAATPPFAILPRPDLLFSRRAERFALLAHDHALKPYLYFLAGALRGPASRARGLARA